MRTLLLSILLTHFFFFPKIERNTIYDKIPPVFNFGRAYYCRRVKSPVRAVCVVKKASASALFHCALFFSFDNLNGRQNTIVMNADNQMQLHILFDVIYTEMHNKNNNYSESTKSQHKSNTPKLQHPQYTYTKDGHYLVSFFLKSRHFTRRHRRSFPSLDFSVAAAAAAASYSLYTACRRRAKGLRSFYCQIVGDEPARASLHERAALRARVTRLIK